jgi:hypothetical protein
LGDIAGAPLVQGFASLESVTGGVRRSYERGTMYLRSGSDPVFLNLTAAQRFDQLGNTNSFLGFPTSDFELDPSDLTSGVARFEGGAIFFWADLGAIEISQVSVRFIGFHCFSESDDFTSGSDEVFFAFGILPIDVAQRETKLTGIHEQVDAGDTRPDIIELYRGPPQGLIISVNLSEHDEGDPQAYKENVDIAMDKAADRLIEALHAVPVVGIPLAAVAEIAFVIGGPALKKK